MLIFVPPSETKAFPVQAAPVKLGSLVLPELTPVRARLLKALARLARGRAPAALAALGLSPGQSGELAHNRELLSAPAGVAAEVYTGVLYDALGLPGLHRRSIPADQVLIFSGLWGVLRPTDRIPHYRCPAGAKLPVAGPVSAAWRKALRAPLAAQVGDRLVVDLRSSAYASLWTPGANAVTVRMLHEREPGGVGQALGRLALQQGDEGPAHPGTARIGTAARQAGGVRGPGARARLPGRAGSRRQPSAGPGRAGYRGA